MTRAMDPEVADAIWTAIEPILSVPDDGHPLGCHNPRVPDKVCFRGILIRLVTGSSWTDIEAIMNFEVSDTTLRTRRDDWIDAGVFDQLAIEALAAYDRIIELDLDVVAIDGSLHKAPYGGEGTGRSPVDRAKLGWKWSVASERSGIPIGWWIDGANRNDVVMLEPDPRLDRRQRTPRRDRHPHARSQLRLPEDPRPAPRPRTRRAGHPTPRHQAPAGTPHRLTLGLRWIVEATNTWWSSYGQLRRSTDPKIRHRHAALQLATVVLIVGRLIDCNRWSPA